MNWCIFAQFPWVPIVPPLLWLPIYLPLHRLLNELKSSDIKGYNILNVLVNQSFQGYQSKNNSGSMTEEEALSILGLKKGVTDEEIKKAYYNLMKKFHPDKDGNNYLSNLITEAKNKLLNQ